MKKPSDDSKLEAYLKTAKILGLGLFLCFVIMTYVGAAYANLRIPYALGAAVIEVAILCGPGLFAATSSGPKKSLLDGSGALALAILVQGLFFLALEPLNCTDFAGSATVMLIVALPLLVHFWPYFVTGAILAIPFTSLALRGNLLNRTIIVLGLLIAIGLLIFLFDLHDWHMYGVSCGLSI